MPGILTANMILDAVEEVTADIDGAADFEDWNLVEAMEKHLYLLDRELEFFSE